MLSSGLFCLSTKTLSRNLHFSELRYVSADVACCQTAGMFVCVFESGITGLIEGGQLVQVVTHDINNLQRSGRDVSSSRTVSALERRAPCIASLRSLGTDRLCLRTLMFGDGYTALIFCVIRCRNVSPKIRLCHNILVTFYAH